MEIFVAHRNKLLYLRDFRIETEGIEELSVEEKREDKRFVFVGLKDYFGTVKREHKVDLEREIDIDKEYEEIMNKSRGKRHSHANRGTFQREEEGKSRAVSFVMG